MDFAILGLLALMVCFGALALYPARIRWEDERSEGETRWERGRR